MIVIGYEWATKIILGKKKHMKYLERLLKDISEMCIKTKSKNRNTIEDLLKNDNKYLE